MKKLIFVLLLSVLVLASCSQVQDGGSDSDTDAADSKLESEAETDDTSDTADETKDKEPDILIDIPEVPEPDDEELVHPDVDLTKYTMRDVSEEIKYTVQNDHERISALVNAYLLDESYYDELFETVYFRYVCDSDFYRHVGHTGVPIYYIKKDEYSEESDDFSFYEEDSGHTYWLSRYGNLNTYEKLPAYMYDHFSHNVVYDLEGFTIKNVDGYIYSTDVCGIEPGTFEPTFELFVDKNIIVLKITREWPEDIPRESNVDYYIMKYQDRGYYMGRWLWVYFDSIYDVIPEYEAYLAEK